MKNAGFTLIELSIVMVIIGLIIGGILTGQELIHGAGVRATMSQVIKYNAAVNSFQMKYNAPPGDFKNASSFIVGAHNGNGNNLIGRIDGPSTPDGAYSNPIPPYGDGLNEYANFWSQLSAIGLIEGGYPATSSYGSNVGVNFPKIQINSAVGIFAYGNTGDNINFYQLGLINADSDNPSADCSYFLSPSDAYAIHSKMDDGLPASGIVVARGLKKASPPPNYAGGFEGEATFTTTLGGDLISCVVGASYASSTGYNTAAPTSSASCILRIRIN